MSKQVIMLHGCPTDIAKAANPETRNFDKHWMPWLKKELETRGVSAAIPIMPTPWQPDYAKFKQEFDKNVVGEDAVLIGHSCGCAFLVRWLGETKKKISKLILVAPWKFPESDNVIEKDFYNYPIDEGLRSRVGEVVIFTSDNEEEDGKKSVKIFHDALGGDVIELKGRGHFVLSHMGTERFPELLESILK